MTIRRDTRLQMWTRGCINSAGSKMHPIGLRVFAAQTYASVTLAVLSSGNGWQGRAFVCTQPVFITPIGT